MNLNISAALLAIQAVNHNSDLPALIGNSQDIDWATQIRAEMLIQANHTVAHTQHLLRVGETPAQTLSETILASARLRDAAPASWWISRRHLSIETVLSELAMRPYDMEYGGT